MLSLRRWYRSLFVLFVAAHLLVDLAMPHAGAFRFNPAESTVGVRVQPVQASDLKPAPRVDPLPEPVESARMEISTPADPVQKVKAPELIVLLPRRDPSADRSPQPSLADPLTSAPLS